MHRIALMLCLWVLARGVFAGELAVPDGEILITVSGNISHSNSEHGAEFDLQMLEDLGATTVVTDSPWTKSVTAFTGVRMSVLLNAVGAQSSQFRATALDGYWYDVNDVDFDAYPVILAYKRNGKFMNARNLGPLWIMFPFDDYPELDTEINKASCVWHINSLVVQ